MSGRCVLIFASEMPSTVELVSRRSEVNCTILFPTLGYRRHYGPLHIIIIIIVEICKAPTLRLKALNKHTHIMYIEMEMLSKKINMYISTSVQA